jgi:hypothetical protein
VAPRTRSNKEASAMSSPVLILTAFLLAVIFGLIDFLAQTM